MLEWTSNVTQSKQSAFPRWYQGMSEWEDWDAQMGRFSNPLEPNMILWFLQQLTRGKFSLDIIKYMYSEVLNSGKINGLACTCDICLQRGSFFLVQLYSYNSMWSLQESNCIIDIVILF